MLTHLHFWFNQPYAYLSSNPIGAGGGLPPDNQRQGKEVPQGEEGEEKRGCKGVAHKAKGMQQNDEMMVMVGVVVKRGERGCMLCFPSSAATVRLHKTLGLAP